MVMTRDGIPLCHHVFPGITADKTTFADVVNDLKSRFNLTRIVFVGNRGMLSDANLSMIIGVCMNYFKEMHVIKLSLILFLTLPSLAYAYSDPGSGLLLWQLLGSFFIGLLFYVRRIIAYFKGLLHKND
jgi:hypothetical protein